MFSSKNSSNTEIDWSGRLILTFNATAVNFSVYTRKPINMDTKDLMASVCCV